MDTENTPIDGTCESTRIAGTRPSTETKTILLVDDDAKLLRGLQRSFADEDFEILTALCPAEARVILEQHPVDLVISDNVMTGTLGTDFLVELRQKYPDLALMMLSGFVPRAATKSLLTEIGVFRILNKPCDSSVVAEAISDAFAAPNPTSNADAVDAEDSELEDSVS